MTETVCFTVFAVAGGAVLAAPVAAGGLGLGVVSSGAIMAGHRAADQRQRCGRKGVLPRRGGLAGRQERRHRHSGRRRRRGGRLGGCAKLAPFLAPALTKSLVANGLFTNVAEETLAKAVAAVVAGSAGGMVQGAITDGVRVLRGQATMEQLLRNVVINLIAGGRSRAWSGTTSPEKLSPGGPVTTTPQTRNVRVANPELVAQYESIANERLPDVVDATIAAEHATPGRARLAQLEADFNALRGEVATPRT